MIIENEVKLVDRFEKGNAILEMVLFVPLALFFLFIAIDAGLSLTQRAGVQDAFRSGVNSLPLFAKEHGASTQTTDLVAQEIFNNLSNQFSLYPNSDNYYVCLLYTSPSPRDQRGSRMPSSA